MSASFVDRDGPFDALFLENFDAVYELSAAELADWHVVDSTDQSPTDVPAAVPALLQSSLRSSQLPDHFAPSSRPERRCRW